MEVVLVEAKDLIAADWGGTSDPYVSVRYGNTRKRTKVMVFFLGLRLMNACKLCNQRPLQKLTRCNGILTVIGCTQDAGTTMESNSGVHR